MRLKEHHDHALDQILREWGRWRRQELSEVAPRDPLRGASWQRQIKRDKGWEEIAHEIDREPDPTICERVQAAFERLKRHDTGYEIVIRDFYVDGFGWPPRQLLGYARYLMWKHGA